MTRNDLPLDQMHSLVRRVLGRALYFAFDQIPVFLPKGVS